MDINQQLQPIVAGLIDNLKANLEQELRSKVTDEVVRTIANTEIESIVTDLITAQLTDRLDKFNFTETSRIQLNKLVGSLMEGINKTLVESANAQITQEIKQQLKSIDVNLVVNEVVKFNIKNYLNLHNFPNNSISHRAVSFEDFTMSGDQIKGGIIDNFGSTGIEDRATHVQMTLMDHATAFEGPLWAPSAVIKGDLTVEGDLLIKGEVPTNSVLFTNLVEYSSIKVKGLLNTELFTNYSDIIFAKIKDDGIDLNKITQHGKEIINDNQIGYHITDSNLQRVGILTDLQTKGESLLSETLYVTNRRVGVNTISPSAALAVWDEEVELTMSKRKQDTGYIGTARSQQLILGSNNKDNLILNADGSVVVSSIYVGKVEMTSATAVPKTEGRRGQIVWNELPDHGLPMGWVCITGSRWAGFGKIE